MLLSPKQADYIKNSTHRWNFKIGATGSGKTYLDFIYVIPKRLRERSKTPGLNVIIGVTQKTVERNVLAPMREYWGEQLVGEVSQTEGTVRLFGEIVHIFGAEKVSQVAKLRGATIKYAYGDEVVDWCKDVFDLLKSRMRLKNSQFDGTGNPQQKNHWLKKFLDSDADIFYQNLTIDDNPFLPEEVVTELKKEYFGTVLYNRYILGQWTNAEGVILRQLADDPNRWQHKSEELPHFSFVSVGVDIGGTKSHTPFIATGITPGWKELVSFHEYRIKHEKGTVDVDLICNRLITFVETLLQEGQDVRFVWVDNAEQVILNTITSCFREKRLPVKVFGCKKYDAPTRIQSYVYLLNTERMKFHKVPMLMESLTTAMYDEKSKQDKILDDFTTDIDTFDAHFYSFSYFLPYFGIQIKQEGE